MSPLFLRFGAGAFLSFFEKLGWFRKVISGSSFHFVKIYLCKTLDLI